MAIFHYLTTSSADSRASFPNVSELTVSNRNYSSSRWYCKLQKTESIMRWRRRICGGGASIEAGGTSTSTPIYRLSNGIFLSGTVISIRNYLDILQRRQAILLVASIRPEVQWSLMKNVLGIIFRVDAGCRRLECNPIKIRRTCGVLGRACYVVGIGMDWCNISLI